MSYESCCCLELNTITTTEVRTLWATSYQQCTQTVKQSQRVCANWSPWFRWLCILWQYVVFFVCVVWITITKIYWTTLGYASLVTCLLVGADFGVRVLNNVLGNNLASSIALGLGVNTPPNPIAKPGWNLSFSDEFSGGPSVDATKWYTIPPDLPNPFLDGDKYVATGTIPPGYYDNSAVDVSGGTAKLLIASAPQTFVVKDWNGPILNSSGQPYTVSIPIKVGYLVSKRIFPWGTQEAFSQRFGYFEIRCKMPASAATWPAFWLSGAFDWPPEIDVFEVFRSSSPSQFVSTYHWGAVGQCFDHQSEAVVHNVNDIAQDFHIYACEWDSCFIKWYYDNLLVRVAYHNVTNVFEPMEVIVNNAVDTQNNSGNYMTTLTLPNALEVDYVRVYAK